MRFKALTRPERWILLGIPVLFVIGSALHFLYELTGDNVLLGLISPVNESIFEHTKLVVLPIILWWMLFYRFAGEQYPINKSRWYAGALAALLAAIAAIPMLYYFYTGAFGFESLRVDVLILLLALAIGQLFGLHVYRRSKGKNPRCVLIAMGVIVLIYAVFTFIPPQLPLFEG